MLLCVATSGYVFVHVRISGFVATIAKAKEVSFSTDTRDLALRRAGTILAETTSRREELATFVVSDSNSLRIIEAVEATAKRENVKTTIGSVSVLSTTLTYHEPVRVTLSAQGSLGDLVRFASALETLPEASRLVTMSFQVSDNHLWFGTFVIDFIKEKSPTL
ncbi:MAG: hypothetical protein V4449_00430 [Patescibacteria group bacterium]